MNIAHETCAPRRSGEASSVRARCIIDEVLRIVRRHLVAIALCVVSSQVCAAQVVRVIARDSVANLPVPRALVTVWRDQSTVQLHGLTNDAGAVSIRLPSSGRWSVSVRRIGFIPSIGVARVTGDREVVTVTVPMRAMGFTLPTTRVMAAKGSCARAQGSHDRTSALWDQVTLALRALATAERDRARATPLRAVVYDRELDRSLRVISETPVQIRRGLGRPFTAAHPESLALRGYVQADADLTLRYFAPDEHALLSDAFATTHCFDTPATDSNPALAELRFRPSSLQRTPDIAGSAFIDTASGALRRITFRFVNTGALFPDGTAHAGGDVRLDQLPDGEWIVSAWSIRMPRMVRVTWARSPRLSGYHEVGGAVDTLSAAVSVVATVATPPRLDTTVLTDDRQNRDTTRTRPTGDQVVVGGKLVVATSAVALRTRDWRRGFADRRRFNIGTFLDSTALATSAARSALELLAQLSAISLFVVPDGVPAPSRVDDVDLAEAWIAGALLPMMLPVGGSRAAGQCLVKVYVDAERASAATLRSMPARRIGGVEFYRGPRDVPDGFRRSGNICGTVLLWAKAENDLVP